MQNQENPQTDSVQEAGPKPAASTPLIDWFIRLVKGVLIGIGFITPGLSGGVLAVILGLYEPLIRFIANIRHKFLKNLLFFLPVGIGGAVGVVLFSKVVDWAFKVNPAAFTWLFIGFIVGTFPSLFKTAGKQGRKSIHWVLLVLVAVGMFAFMKWMVGSRSITVAQNFLNWVLMGGLIGLGVVVPGMSPSNFLIYLGMYQPMAAGISSLNFGVIIPLVIGGAAVVFGFAKLVASLFDKAYATMYHIILGIVIGSTLAIIPASVGSAGNALLCAALFLAGVLASWGLAKVDEAHPHESLF